MVDTIFVCRNSPSLMT